MLNFEFDETKSKINLDKHGIDFNVATQLFLSPYYESKAKSLNSEDRYLAIGLIKTPKYPLGIFFTIVYTMRNKNIRIISARRSKKKEINFYQSNFK